MELTIEQLKKIMPASKYAAGYLPFLNKWMHWYGIDKTPNRMAHFLAQIAHESNQLNVITENLNYSYEALVKIFKGDVDQNKDRVLSESELKRAKDLARKPEQIANFVYANQGGNGNEASGDGWRYRGRGPIQCTLKDNYREMGEDWKVDLLAHPELLEQPDSAIRSACWYFWKHDLNKLADAGASVALITSRINAAKLGLKQREAFYKVAISVLKEG